MGASAGRFDVVVVGAGIVGCACARECALAALRVAVVEARQPASGATGAAMGHIVVMDDSPAQLALTRYSRGLWNELAAQLPESAHYHQPGTLWIAASDAEMAEVRGRQRAYQQAGIAAEVLDAQSVAEAEPHLRPGIAGGMLVSEDAVLSPPAAAAFLLDEAVRGGALVMRGLSVVRAAAGQVTLSDGDVLAAGRIVLATGVETALLPGLPIQKRKGHLVLTEPAPGFLRHQVVELGYLQSAHKVVADSVAFNVQPRPNGQLLVGSSRQYGNDHPAVDPAMIERMLARAFAYMPDLERMAVSRSWTGFRAATPDKLPLMGPTEDATLMLAMGFEGLGITNSVGAARLVIDQLLGRPTAVDVSAFLPSRFAMDTTALLQEMPCTGRV